MAVDFGKTAQDYARFRAGFPPALFERLRAQGIGLPGQHLLDLGTGTGTLARGFARAGCRVVGLDPAQPLLKQARALAAQEGVEVTFQEGRAERSGFPDAAFDVVAAGQCWHWFDRPAAAAESRRVLKPGGALLLAYFDWLPLPGNVVEATERLILAHNPAWPAAGGRGFHPEWFADLGIGGFTGIESFSFEVDVPYSHEAWRGRIRASAGVAASLEAAAVARFDGELATLLAGAFPAEPLAVPHRVFALWGRRP